MEMAKTTPWTFTWFNKTIEIAHSAEAAIDTYGATITNLTKQAYEDFGTPLRFGQILQDAYVKNMPKERVMAKHNLTEAQYNKFMDKTVLGAHKNMTDRMWERAFRGHEFLKLNVANRLRQQGKSEDYIKQVMNAMTIYKVDRYFPRYDEMLETIIEGKAKSLAQAIVDGEMGPDAIAKQYKMMHLNHRKDTDRPIELDYEKAMNTYMYKTVSWTARQEQIYWGEKMTKRFLAELDKPMTGKKKEAMEQLRRYFTRLNNTLIGKNHKYVDPRLVQNGNWFMEYESPDGVTNRLDLETTSKEEANRKMAYAKIDPANQIIDNMTNIMLSASFIKNIGPLNWTSSMRNLAQIHLVATQAGYKAMGNEIQDYKKWDWDNDTGGKTTYREIVDLQVRKAGLKYGYTKGEAGQEVETTELYQVLNDYILAELGTSDKMMTGLDWSRKIRKGAAEFAEMSSQMTYKSKGVEKRILKLPQVLAFGGVEEIIRPMAFRAGFHPVFKYYKELYDRNNNTMTVQERTDLAAAKAYEAGKLMETMTMFDYHQYNSPEVMRRNGLSGNMAKLVFQFQKFTAGYYNTIYRNLRRAMYEYKDAEGWSDKLVNEYTGRLARLAATHLGVLALTGVTGVDLYNFIREDRSAFMWGLIKMAWGAVFGGDNEPDHFTKKQTPIPYLIGPIPGSMVSLGLVLAGVNMGIEYPLDEWAEYNLMPRGPMKIGKAAATIVNPKTASYSAADQTFRLIGLAKIRKEDDWYHGR